jgi:hypothetical protein
MQNKYAAVSFQKIVSFVVLLFDIAFTNKNTRCLSSLQTHAHRVVSAALTMKLPDA